MLRLLATCLLSALTAASVRADPVAEFYKGRTVTVFIGYETGGAYDFYGRAVAKFLPRHMPGAPQALPMNRPGASSMVLGNHLARTAPRDGTAIGIVNSALLFDPLFSGAESKAQFKGPDLTMIGNVTRHAAVLISWRDSGVKSLADLRSKELVIGAMTKTGDTYVLPSAVRKVLKLDNLKIVTGYPGTREAVLAIERGEIKGRVWDMEAIRATRPQWLKDGSINIIAQLAAERMPDVPPEVPLVNDFVTSEDDKRVLNTIFITTVLARPFIAPPDLPAERTKALRDAFMGVMKDPEFLAEMAKLSLSIHATSGEEMQHMVADAYALPDALVRKVRDVLAD